MRVDIEGELKNAQQIRIQKMTKILRTRSITLRAHQNGRRRDKNYTGNHKSRIKYGPSHDMFNPSGRPKPELDSFFWNFLKPRGISCLSTKTSRTVGLILTVSNARGLSCIKRPGPIKEGAPGVSCSSPKEYPNM